MPTLDGDIRVSKQGLKRARRQLVQLEDCHIDEDGSVPQWLRVARLCVDSKLEEVKDDE